MRAPKMIIFDVQGTLIDVSGIRHLVEGPKRDFDAFHEATMSCPTHEWVAASARLFSAQGFKIGVLTGMTERFRHPLGLYLADRQIPSDELLMRPNGLFCPDVDLKAWRLRELRQRYDVVGAYDDQPRLVDLWTNEGLATVKVPGWEG